MGDPIIIWLPGTVYDLTALCQAGASEEGLPAASSYYYCGDAGDAGDGYGSIYCCLGE